MSHGKAKSWLGKGLILILCAALVLSTLAGCAKDKGAKTPSGGQVAGNVSKLTVPSSEGLLFKLKEDNTYEVSGCDASLLHPCVLIPATHEGKPVTSIGKEAFYDVQCEESESDEETIAFVMQGDSPSLRIKRVVFEAGCQVIEIGERAFAYCMKMRSIRLPDSLTTVGKNAFEECLLLEVQNPSELLLTWDEQNEYLAEFDLPPVYEYGADGESRLYIDAAGYTFYIDGETFFLLDYIGAATQLTLPASYAGKPYKIGGVAFAFEPELTCVTIPNSVTEIGSCAFIYCANLKEVSIAESVTRIDWKTFCGCTSLTEITIPASVTRIGGGIFEGCTNLARVTWNVVRCKNEAIYAPSFGGCTSLTEVTFGDNVQEIPTYLFIGCTGITEITIPANVTGIGMFAFGGCTKLARVTFAETTGWRVNDSPIGLSSDPTVNAKYLTGVYSRYRWARIR